MQRYILLLMLLLITGCATVPGPLTGKLYYDTSDKGYREEVIMVYFKNHPELDPEIKKLIIAGKVWWGMTREELIVVKGRPNDINRTISLASTREQWVYGGYDPLFRSYTKPAYYYLDNGILTAWQD